MNSTRLESPPQSSSSSLDGFIDRTLEASHGYFELGLLDDAHAELDRLAGIPDTNIAVTMCRLALLSHEERWTEADRCSEALCVLEPDNLDHFLNRASILRTLNQVADASAVLLSGPLDLVGLPEYHFQLACYHALLGDVHEAIEDLFRAADLDKETWTRLDTEPDLAAVREHYESLAARRRKAARRDLDCPF